MLRMKKLLACALALALFTTGCGLAALADTLSLPAALARIETEAFRGNTSLTDIVIPDNCAEIGPFAFADCASLRTALIPEGVTQISDTAFDGCGGLTILGWTGSAAERFADANGIPFFPFDPVDMDESDPWYLSGEMADGEGDSGTVHLTWEGNGTARSYGVYEIIEGIEVLRGIYEDTEATLYGVGSGEHSYAVRPLKVSDGIPVPGILSQTLTVDMTEGAEPPEMTYADESSDQEVTLRWSGEAESFDILEQGADGSMTVIKTVHGNEAVLGDVAPGAHSYFIRANTLTGASAISACREIYVYGAETVSLDTDSISIYPAQLKTLTATVSPADTGSAKLTWTSSQTDVAVVAEDGTVTGVAPGNAMITCTLENGSAASCEVAVLASETVNRDDFTVVDGVLTEYKGTVKELVIPDDLGIWKIGDGTFRKNQGIRSIEIPEGIIEIGEGSFSSTNLTSVRIPSSVTTIGYAAFYNCTSLQHVETGLGLKAIGDYAFEYCRNLAEFEIPSTVTTIGKGAFGHCEKLESIEIPQGVTSIDYNAFEYCTGLKTLDIQPGITHIGSAAFAHCESLTSAILEPGTARMGTTMFGGCKSLTHVEIPSSVTEIPAGAFSGCSSLTNIEISSSITAIGDAAFSGSGLTEVTIPDGVTAINEDTFYNCHNLAKIHIPEGVTSIGSDAFLGCESLTEVSLPESVTSIGHYAFQDCTGLVRIQMPEHMDYLGTEAFSGCESLVEITIPKGVSYLIRWTFYKCSSLVRVVVSDTVQSIDGNAFIYCSNLDQVVLLNPDTVLKNNSFYKHPTIYGVPGGNVENYAKSNNFTFRPLEEYYASGSKPADDAPITDTSGAVLMCTGMSLNTDAIFGQSGLLSSSEISTDDSVVSVDSGRATALQKGTVTLTAYLTGGEKVTRKVKVLGGFTRTKLELLAGDEADLAWEPLPGYTPGEPYHHSDALTLGESVSVDASGHVTALKYNIGAPDHIRMDMGNGLYTQCDVYVRRPPTSVKLEPAELMLSAKQQQTLTASVDAAELSRGFTFTSADPKIASVDDTGTVTGVSAGSTTITVTAHNGATGQCKVSVVPEGIDDQVLQGYLADIRTQCRQLINMSKVFDGGYYRADGTHVDGLDPVDMTNLVQGIYASILGSNADTVFSREVRALTLADAIMRSIATKSEAKWVSIDVINSALGNINDFDDFTKYVSKLLSVLANEAGLISLDLSDYEGKGGFLAYYKDNNLLDNLDVQIPEFFSLAEDVGKVAESFLTAWRKYDLYMSADQAKLNQYIKALEFSDDDDVQAAAMLLRAFKDKNECLQVVLALHGFIKGEKMAAKYIWKFVKKSASSAIPEVGLFLAGIKVGKISNSFLFNLNSVQRNVYRAQYVIKAVNGYRSVFENALNAFTADPLDPEKFQVFAEAELAFSRLVCEEYKAYGAIPDAMAKGGYAWIYNLKHDGTLKGTAASCESAGDQALTLAKAYIASYGKEVLGISE